MGFVGEVRLSQIITTYGPGSIVDLKMISVMPLGVDEWIEWYTSRNDGSIPNDMEIKDKRLINLLRSQKFRKLEGFIQLSPDNRKHYYFEDFRRINREYFVRIFPEKLFCPNCRRIDFFFRLMQANKDPGKRQKFLKLPLTCKYCVDLENIPKSKIQLNPARLIIMCPKGHIDDFPWYRWAHLHSKYCNKNDKLKLNYKGKTGELKDLIIKCFECNSFNSLQKVFDENYIKSNKLYCSGRKPWLKIKNDSCNLPMVVSLRGATNVYFPVIHSTLKVPEKASDKIWKSEIKKYLELFGEDQLTTELLPNFKILLRKTISDDKNFPDDNTLLNFHMQNSNDNTSNVKYIRYAEYVSLSRDIPPPTKEFSAKKYDFSENSLIGKFFSKITIIDQLVEVRVLSEFTRVKSSGDVLSQLTTSSESNEIENTEISRHPYNLKYLPGIEYNGEGIYFELNPEILSTWISRKIIERTNRLISLESDSPFELSPHVILTHTLSHALILSLSEEVGYSTSSLRERLYVDIRDPDNNLFVPGFIVYTAAADSEGTLGGLIEIIKNDQLNAILERMIEKMSWCSMDPICIENLCLSQDQFKNHAACHACLFLPEVSCEARNEYLDRALLIGTTNNRSIGYYKEDDDY